MTDTSLTAPPRFHQPGLLGYAALLAVGALVVSSLVSTAPAPDKLVHGIQRLFAPSGMLTQMFPPDFTRIQPIGCLIERDRHVFGRHGGDNRLTAGRRGDRHQARPRTERADGRQMCGSRLAARTGDNQHVAVVALVTIGRPRRDQLASRGRVDALIAANVDPVSGQPELKGAPATVRPFAAAWFAFAVMRQPPDLHGFDYFATAAISCGHRVELAGCTDPSSWDDVANNLLLAGVRSEDAETLAYHDPAAGQFRYAAFAGNQLAGALFVARKPVTVARTWIAEQLTVEVPAPARLRLLAGRPGGEVKDRGRVICACFEVGLNEIVDAIVAQGASDVAAVGARVKAGTNCGSCRTEIGRILDEARISKAG